MPFESFIVSPVTSVRLDVYLTQRDQTLSRSQIAKWIMDGRVTVNGRKVRPSLKLVGGEEIVILPPAPVDSTIKAENIPLHILHEDDDLIVLNKSAHMVVHPAAGHSSGTLTHALIAHAGNLSTIGGVHRPGIVHRLDKGTSGIMLIAKNDLAHRNLQEQFKNHTIKKTYWALVWGKLAKSSGTIKTMIARSRVNRKKFSVHATQGKEAVTHYRVLDSNTQYTLVEVELETGRTHQIRVHLSHLHNGIVGDDLYGRARKVLKVGPDHTLLHSRKIEFTHPATGRRFKKTAPLPDDFKAFLKNAGIKLPKGGNP